MSVVRCEWSVAFSTHIQTVPAWPEATFRNRVLLNSYFNGQRTPDNGRYRILHPYAGPKIFLGAFAVNRKAVA